MTSRNAGAITAAQLAIHSKATSLEEIRAIVKKEPVFELAAGQAARSGASLAKYNVAHFEISLEDIESCAQANSKINKLLKNIKESRNKFDFVTIYIRTNKFEIGSSYDLSEEVLSVLVHSGIGINLLA